MLDFLTEAIDLFAEGKAGFHVLAEGKIGFLFEGEIHLQNYRNVLY